MVVLLIPIPFALTLLQVMGRSETAEREEKPWQGDFLIAGSIFGFTIWMISEILSLFEWLDRPYLAATWGFLVLAGTFYSWRGGNMARGWWRLRSLLPRKANGNLGLYFVTALLFALILAVAWVSPPNNIDTLQYHMPRVEQWIQNHSLKHFPTPYDNQNARPYWAELAMLNLRILWGSDRPVSLPQAFSLLGVMVAVSGIASLLGGSPRVQWLSAAIAFSVPMVVLQSTTPKNDIVSGWWVLTFAFFVVLAAKRDLEIQESVARSLSLGLGILTKGTVIPFVAPFLLWHTLTLLRRRGIFRGGGRLLGIAVLVVAINLPLWLKNFQTYGGAYGSSIPVDLTLDSILPVGGASDELQALSALDREDEFEAPSELSAAEKTVKPSIMREALASATGHISRILRMLAMHFVSPFHAINQLYFRMLSLSPRMFPSGFVSSLRRVAWNHAMTAGNPLHLVGMAVTMVWAAVPRVRKDSAQLPLLMAATTSGLLLISLAGCAGSIYCMRYQLSFFLLGAPAMAIIVGQLAQRWIGLFTAILIAYAIPYVLFNNMRPVVGVTPWPTRIQSVFLADSEEILFALSPDLQDEWEEIASRIKENTCPRVGLLLPRYELEYPLWRLLSAPDSGITLQHLGASEATTRYIDPQFVPCAVICTACQVTTPVSGLPIAADYGHIRLYLVQSE